MSKIINRSKILALIFVFFVVSGLNVNSYEFQKGERLVYDAKYLYIIPLGTASIETKGETEFQGKSVWVVTCEARTTRWISLLFKAEAVLNSYVAKNTLYPHKFEQQLKVAGKPDDILWATYDRLANTMEAEGKGTKKVPADVRDPISAIYFLRAQKLDQDIEITQTVNNNQSTYIFKSKVIGKKQIGAHSCWVISSKIRRENKSMYHSMDALIYISDDERRLPVLIQANTKMGPVTLRLKK